MDFSILFSNLALYNPVKFDDVDAKDLKQIIVDQQSSIQFDSYCIKCAKDSTFKKEHINTPPRVGATIHSTPPAPPNYTKMLNKLISKAYHMNFVCQRNQQHIYHYSFKFMNSTIIKIGQYPSIASIQTAGIKKYEKVLNSDYQDFSKAIGLYSHGIGIGSFVYVRRIFENLVEEMRIEAEKDSTWDNDQFNRSKMDEKIKMLEHLLPNILVVNRKLYGIISKGIHELSEQECLTLFPDVQIAIELILDEKIYEKERIQKAGRLQSFISKTSANLKK